MPPQGQPEETQLHNSFINNIQIPKKLLSYRGKP